MSIASYKCDAPKCKNTTEDYREVEWHVIESCRIVHVDPKDPPGVARCVDWTGQYCCEKCLVDTIHDKLGTIRY